MKYFNHKKMACRMLDSRRLLGGRELGAEGRLGPGRKAGWGGSEPGRKGLGAWGGREAGADGRLGRKRAWGGSEPGAEASME